MATDNAPAISNFHRQCNNSEPVGVGGVFEIRPPCNTLKIREAYRCGSSNSRKILVQLMFQNSRYEGERYFGKRYEEVAKFGWVFMDTDSNEVDVS